MINIDFSKVGLYIHGDITVVVETKESYQENPQVYEDFEKATGGACAALFCEEQRQTVIASLLGQPDYAVNAHMLTHQAVVINTSVLEGLTHNELLAVLFHEIGHIHYGHLTNVTTTVTSEKGIRVMDDNAKELEADAYAAQMVGKEHMASAFEKIIKKIVTRLAKENNVSEKEAAQRMPPELSEKLEARYMALTN